MLFNLTAEYALRAMAQLAMLPAPATARAKDLSVATGIPPDYISKVLRRMVRDGLLHSQRGHGGGFRLARPPAEISFADILASVDEGVDPERCAFGQGTCGAGAPCPLHFAFSKLKEAFRRWAEETTLADVGEGSVALPQFGAAIPAAPADRRG